MQNNVIYHKLVGSMLPTKVRAIDNPPTQLFYRGESVHTLLKQPAVAIVGSRRPTIYGRTITATIARELSQRGVVIVSGLALGVDSVAHQACLDAGGLTIAVLPCGLDDMYPRSHKNLADSIVEAKGVLVSEYPTNTTVHKQNFVARNRIVAALGDIVIVTEAAEHSGALHTANFALNQGKTVMAAPGPITNPLSRGTNNLIKAGALPVTDPQDILTELGISTANRLPVSVSSPEEYIIVTLLKQGVTDGNELLIASKLQPSIFHQTMTMLEIHGQIVSLGANHWKLR